MATPQAAFLDAEDSKKLLTNIGKFISSRSLTDRLRKEASLLKPGISLREKNATDILNIVAIRRDGLADVDVLQNILGKLGHNYFEFQDDIMTSSNNRGKGFIERFYSYNILLFVLQ